MAIDYGRLPKDGFAKLVSELLVEDLRESLNFWRDALGFEIAYQRLDLTMLGSMGVDWRMM